MTPCLFHLCYVSWMLYMQSDRFQVNCAGQCSQWASCNAVHKPATQTNTRAPFVAWKLRRRPELYNIFVLSFVEMCAM